jgi:hypothetical protein
MAQKEIGIKLKITSEGQEKVINNLNDLETELSTLQSKLKTLDFGSAAFKEASTNIQILRTKIDDIDKSTEGLGAEKRFRAIGDAINILTGSFQVLSGAIGLVVSNEQTLEEVQRAEKAALDVLNVALGINAINTALVESATLRKAAAEKLATLATRAATIAQAAWNAVLLANPIGLVIAAVAALTAGIYLLVRATNSETDAEEELNKQLEISKDLQIELNNVARKTAQEEKIALSILTDNVKQRNLELKVLEDLKKEFPGFNTFISQNNELTDRGNEFLTRNIALQEIDAKLKALRDKKVETEIQNIEDFNEELESQNTFWGKLSASVRGSLTPFGKYVVMAKDLNAATEEGTRKIGIYNREIENLQGQYDDALGAIRPFTDELEKQKKAEEEAAKAAQKAADNIEKRNQAQIKALQDRINAQKNYLQNLQKLLNDEIEVQSDVLERVRDIIQQQEDLITKRNEFAAKESEKLFTTLDEILFKVIPTAKEEKLLEDSYFKLFTTIKKGVDEGVISLDGVELNLQGLIDLYDQYNQKVKPEFAAGALQAINNGTITEEATGSLIRYFKTIQRFSVELSSDRYKDLLPKTLSSEEAGKQIRGFVDLAATELADLTKEQIERETNVRNSIEKNLGLQKKVVKGTEAQKVAAQGYNDRIDLLVDTLAKLAFREGDVVVQSNKIAASLKTLKKESQDNQKELTRLGDVFEVNGQRFEGVSKQLTETELANLGKILSNSFSQSEEAFTGFLDKVLNNTSGFRDRLLRIIEPQDFVKLLGDAAKGLNNLTFENQQQLETLIQKLQTYQVELGDAITTTATDANGEIVELGTGYTSLAEIIDLLIKKQKELKEATKDTAKTWEETFSESNFKRIADIVLNVFNDISARLSNIVATQNSLLLEQLAYQEQATISDLDKLKGENAKENEKIEAEKLKVQQEYAKRRFEIEKEARVQELQFTLANSLAQSAQAIINALATIPAPFGAIYSGVIAGLTAAQVAVINDQIQFTQSKQFIARRGGLIGGDSHDDISGGVPAMLEGGEFVVNKEAVRNFGDIVSSINTSTGGRPLSIDDSRIVQAIAKQNMNTKTPIKAYVLYNDIQDTTKLNTKIEQLARL